MGTKQFIYCTTKCNERKIKLYPDKATSIGKGCGGKAIYRKGTYVLTLSTLDFHHSESCSIWPDIRKLTTLIISFTIYILWKILNRTNLCWSDFTIMSLRRRNYYLILLLPDQYSLSGDQYPRRSSKALASSNQ